MLSTIKKFFNWNTQTHSDYAYTDYKKYIAWITSCYKEVSSRLPDISTLARTRIPNSLAGVKTSFWSHKELIIGGAAIAIALIAISCLMKRKSHRPIVIMEPILNSASPPIERSPQSPILKMESSLNYARLSIEIPKGIRIPPNVTLTFCIDISKSMRGEREKNVKSAVESVLNSAQKVIDTIEGANIEIAIVGFNKSPTTISKPIKITSTKGTRKNSAIEALKSNLNRYESRGETDIIAGLEEATHHLEEMAKKNKRGVHTLILLTDGVETLLQSRVSAIHARLAAARAKLFAIGIGSAHKKETLMKLAPTSGSFTGTYIDTTLGQDTIGSAISKIYTQAIASFGKLTLRSSQLSAGTWSVNKSPSVMKNNESKCKLGSLSEETKMETLVEIHGARLNSPLDLSTVTFDLTFKDPEGRRGKLSLPWNPNKTIDNQIVSFAANYRRQSS